MKVKDLKKKLEEFDDDLEVHIIFDNELESVVTVEKTIKRQKLVNGSYKNVEPYDVVIID